VATSLVDSPPAAANGQAPPPESSAGAGTPPPSPGAPAPVASGRNCLKCAAPLQDGQDWCLQCGAGAPGSLGTSGWRAGALALAAVAVLVLGAAAAAVAALSKSAPKAPVVTTTVAQAPTAATSPAPATTPSTSTPAPGAVAKAKATLPLGSVKPPKIPLTAVTPKASEKAAAKAPATEGKTSTPTSPATTTTPSTTSGSSTTGEASGEESQQSAILLDTNAASTYNPYNYPASWFGDPSLAIDGDHSTAWTAQVNPATAPALAEGLLIDLKTKQMVSVLQLVTSTPGITVQVYGAIGHTVPESITNPAWVPLSAFKIAKKKHLRLKLRDSKKAFTFIALWISKAPQSAIGTATAPGHVDVNEVELFPTS
jgi:hypothetical protein